MSEHERRLAAGENRLHVVTDFDFEDEFPEPGTEPIRGDGNRTRRRRWQALIAVAVVTALTVTAAITGRWPFGGSSESTLKISGALPYWSTPANAGKVLQNKENFTSVSPWMYGLDQDGGIVSLLPESRVAPINEALDELRTAKVEMIPTISNTRDGSWDYPTIIRILRDPELRARHIADIVRLTKMKDYPGIDIDYENFQAADRSTFTTFITELAGALHNQDKTLSVDLFAKTSDRGYDVRNQAQDYHALGQVVDSIRLMAYDWHWNSSEPGPIAPINWVHSVLDYALTQIPAKKIILGVPAYGYDWVGKKGRLVSWLQVYGLEQKYGADVHWNRTAQSPWLTYRSADGQRHVVWFENAYSSLAKLALARSLKLGGAYLWLAGDEDDLLWDRLSPKAIDDATKASTQRQEAPPS